MKPALTVGTPVIRPQNLPVILPEMEKGLEWFDLRWWVAIDNKFIPRPKYDIAWMGGRNWIRFEAVDIPWGARIHGERIQNHMLDDVDPESWWCGMADDNLPTPGFFEALRREADAGAEIVVFPCQHSSGLLRAHPNQMCPSGVDGQQLACKRKWIGGLRWDTDTPYPDGEFIKSLYAKEAERFRFVAAPVLQYNRLR